MIPAGTDYQCPLLPLPSQAPSLLLYLMFPSFTSSLLFSILFLTHHSFTFSSTLHLPSPPPSLLDGHSLEPEYLSYLVVSLIQKEIAHMMMFELVSSSARCTLSSSSPLHSQRFFDILGTFLCNVLKAIWLSSSGLVQCREATVSE